MIYYKQFVFNAFQENTYVVYNNVNDAFLLDPGCSNQNEYEILTAFIAKEALKVVAVVNTHCHIDHILGNNWACTKFNVPLFAHALEASNLEMGKMVAQLYGIDYQESSQITSYLEENQQFKLGNDSFELLFTPGHSAGSLTLYNIESGIAFVGDALFAGSIGRTDLPGGNYDILINSIQKKLLTLPAETLVLSGHGPITTIGKEQKSNPFLQ